MPQTGTVTATELRLRSTPSSSTNSNIIKKLPRGTRVQILEDRGDWLKVTADGRTGFVSASFVSKDEAAPPAGDVNSTAGSQPASTQPASTRPASSQPLQPGPDPAPGACRFNGSNAVTPDGRVFAKKFKLGVFNSGRTSIGQFVAAHRDLFPNVSPSRLRVMEAVSSNEGMLEAINTWDNAFLTFGCFQWTIGAGAEAGELPPVIERLKQKSPQVFQKYFGQFGLDVQPSTPKPNVIRRGFFTLNGAVVKTPQQKARLRTLDWAYRFWLSGHDDTVRLAQIEHAMDRVDLFFRCPECLINTRFVGDYVSSEYGVALLLDQHVNRPAHVPRILASAVRTLVQQLGADEPHTWQDAQEQRLIKLYLQARTVPPTMTDSDKRAKKILDAVRAGLASDKRGSYQV